VVVDVVGAVVVVVVDGAAVVVVVDVGGAVVVVVTLVEMVVTGGVGSSAESPHPAVTTTNPAANMATRFENMEPSSRRPAGSTR
jgi:hypothetical protein